MKKSSLNKLNKAVLEGGVSAGDTSFLACDEIVWYALRAMGTVHEARKEKKSWQELQQVLEEAETAIALLLVECHTISQDGEAASDELSRLRALIGDLKGQLRLERDRQYGKKSEKNPCAPAEEETGPMPANAGARQTEESEEQKDDHKDDVAGTEDKTGKTPKTDRAVKRKAPEQTGIGRFPKDMRRVETISELPEDKRFCSRCGSPLKLVGYEVRERLAAIFEMFIESLKTAIYKCPVCENEDGGSVIVRADQPLSPLPGSFGGASIMKEVIWRKYGMGMPFYRVEKEWQAQGWPLSRMTMTNWSNNLAKRLRPLYERIWDHIEVTKRIHADETTLQVLKQHDRPDAKSYMWVYLTGVHEDNQLIFFDYQPDRKHYHAEERLASYSGYLHVDGYDAYHKLPEVIIVCGCLSHARRKFMDALKLLDKQDRNNPNWPEVQAMRFFERIFALEAGFKGMSAEDRKNARMERVKPVMDEFHQWLTSHDGKGGKKFREAVTYCLNQWKYLINFLRDGNVEITNNRAERSIRPFCVGRKNWLFSVSIDGAEAHAVFQSLLTTAKLSGIKPKEYLGWLLENIESIDPPCGSNPLDLDQFLPVSGNSVIPADLYIR